MGLRRLRPVRLLVDPLYTVDPAPGMEDVLKETGSEVKVNLVVVVNDLSNLDEAKAAAKEADLLFGRINPSGKVPTTYPAREEDTIYYNHPERHPGVEEDAGYPVIRYSEGLNMGYRWWQSQGIKPLFAFGHGLSYTTFELSDVAVDTKKLTDAPVTVTAKVTNTGDRAGAEVVQVYLGIPEDGQPPKRLVGFQKVQLEPGESKTATIVIDPAATNHPFGVWCKAAEDFVIRDGEYKVYVGTSSEDTPFIETITC